MKARLEDKKKAIELRKKGLSYKEIQQHVKVSRGLLSGWFKFLSLTTEEEGFLSKRMSERQDKGRIASMLSNRNRRINREITAFEDAKNLFDKYKDNWLFLVGIALYWAEGSKRTGSFQFINSDPDMVYCMFKWIPKFMGIERDKIKCRLYIHKIPGYENCQLFWEKTLGIDSRSFQKTTYKPTSHTVKKNSDYKGCLRLGLGGIYELRLMKAWQKLLIQYYNKVVG